MPEPDDRIILRGIRAEGIVGVYAFEREADRPLTVDVELTIDLAPAGASDAVADTVDYDGVTATVRTLCAQRQPELVETLAVAIADALLDDGRIAAAEVTVHKPGAVADVEDVAVRVVRRRTTR